MPEFLAENNLCGQNILQIVSNGNAIIAELLRLKNYIPNIYRLENKADQIKYSDIILDFSYFKISEAQELKIENDLEIQELDTEFRDNHIEIINRFYLAFESVHQYIHDLNNYVNELNDGIYIQQTIESVLQDNEGKQLLCESLYLYGVMLLILDLHIPGIIRERLLVSYYRYSAQKIHGDSNIDDVCKLLRSTGFSNLPKSKRVPNYPEDYLRRIPIDETFIDMIIGRLRSDDIYNQISIYPLPEHRTTAIANQAGMLYVCLFFTPNVLKNQTSRMREIVDKFFSDNWIVSIYMGITVNLINSWEPYKAAKSALSYSIETDLIKDISIKHSKILSRILVQCKDLLKEGILTEKFIIKNLTKIINLIRECNVTLRWLMLHTSSSCYIENNINSKRHKQVYDQVIQDTNHKQMEIFELLLLTSQLELKVRDSLKLILNEKEKRWLDYRTEASNRICDLIKAFSGEKLLTKIEKNEDLKIWFGEIKKQIDLLSTENLNISGRKIILLIQALEEVQEFHNIESNMQIKQNLIETSQFLHQMIDTINVKENVLINLQLIGDLSYAWHLIDNYTTIMQESIIKKTNLVIKLRATFLKLSSALEIPLLRINQAKSEDLISVSKYYSLELVNYVRKVVQIIPETMFGILSKIINILTKDIKEVPTRLDKDKLKEYAQLDERFQVGQMTYSISVFTEGILMMKKTLVGVIELDPKQLLEDGIRKELVKKVSESLDNGLNFNIKSKSNTELENKLTELSKVIDGYRRSFEYIQDYINIQGLKIWQEELSRIINYNVERECNSFLRNKILDYNSIYQNQTIPIPNFPSNDSNSINFIGRLAREILRQTDPCNTIYLDLNFSWFDYKTHKEIINQHFFPKITESIGVAGLIGLDKLYSFMIVTDLQKMINSLQKNIIQEKAWTDVLHSAIKELYPNTTTIIGSNKFYVNYTNKFMKIWPQFIKWLLNIGQKQILREHIAYELNLNCKFNSKNLESSLRTFNQSLLYDIKINKADPKKPSPPVDLLSELNKYLEAAGLYNPYQQIYIITKNSPYYGIFFFLLVIYHLNKLNYFENVSCLVAKKSSDCIDGNPFIIGIVTVLKQLHRNVLITFVDYMCQYILSFADTNLSLKSELPIEAQRGLQFLKKFLKYSDTSSCVLEKILPEVILNQYEYLSQK